MSSGRPEPRSPRRLLSMSVAHRHGLFVVASALLVFFLFIPTLRAATQEARNPEPARNQSQAAPSPGHGNEPGNDQHKENENAPIPPKNPSETPHDISLGGRKLQYTATAGTLIIRDEEDKPYGSMFYVAYTLDAAESRTRPVSFLYNGGARAATLSVANGTVFPGGASLPSPNPPPAAPP